MMEASGLPDVSCRHHHAGICPCVGIITSGLLQLMIAIISIEVFRSLSKYDAEFTAIDPAPPVGLAALDDGVDQL